MKLNCFFQCGAVTAAVLVLAGCDPQKDAVIFGQAHTLGVSVGQSPSSAAPELVLGYKDGNVALLPTVMRDAAGNPVKLGGISTDGSKRFDETFSVFGQFNANTTASGSEAEPKAGIGLGKFFATGLAAQKLAAGFACGVSEGKDALHCHEP